MKMLIIFLLVGELLLSSSLFANAEAKASVRAVVEETVKYCKSVSKEECFKAIDSDRFSKGPFFIFAFDYKAIGVANGRIPKLIGKNFWNLKNPDGMYIFREQVQTAKKPDGGWLQYKWKKPDGSSIMKLSFIKDVDGSFYVGSGLVVKQKQKQK